MGGFAAKQRRRLERQSLQPSTEQSNVEKARTEVSLKEHPRKQKSSIAKAPKKKKIQKPKHLKRKLEAIESGGIIRSEEEQERLRRQMNEFELIKERRNRLKVAEEQSDLAKSQALGNSYKKARGNNQANIDKQKQGPHKNFPRQVETEPCTGSNDAESKIGQGNKIDDDDSGDEVDLNLNASRQRGKRRRGRKDFSCSAVNTSGVETSADGMEDSIVPTKSFGMMPHSDSVEGDIVSSRETISSVAKSSDELPTKDNNSSNVRRGIGRKPVTDYKVGQSYSGKVVYAKSFGVFFDIGCHSDAFCHVSQLSDQFIESPFESFPVGQMIENSIRVVAIDRRKKRLTVSLQPPSSDKNSGILQRRNEPPSESCDELLPDQDSRSGTAFHVESGNSSSHVTAPRKSKISTTVHAELKNESPEGKSFNELPLAEQLKRARKIARRAQRRAESVQ